MGQTCSAGSISARWLEGSRLREMEINQTVLVELYLHVYFGFGPLAQYYIVPYCCTFSRYLDQTCGRSLEVDGKFVKNGILWKALCQDAQKAMIMTPEFNTMGNPMAGKGYEEIVV